MRSNSQVHVKHYWKIFGWLRDADCWVFNNRKPEGVIEFEILDADMISASVSPSFSFSWLWFIHNLTSWMHSGMDWMSSSTYCGWADFCKWVSSAKEQRRTEWLSITSERGAVYRTCVCACMCLFVWVLHAFMFNSNPCLQARQNDHNAPHNNYRFYSNSLSLSPYSLCLSVFLSPPSLSLSLPLSPSPPSLSLSCPMPICVLDYKVFLCVSLSPLNYHAWNHFIVAP